MVSQQVQQASQMFLLLDLASPSCEDLNLVVREMNQLFTDTLQHADTAVA